MKNFNMKKRWLVLWQRIGARGDASVIYNDLEKRYSEPHRKYHTFKHIVQCLNELDRLDCRSSDKNAIELALWFHDAVYDTHTKGNEEKSAELAYSILKKAELKELGSLVSKLILSTKHKKMPESSLASLLTDIDLSILGQRTKIFDEYERNVRKEYSWVLDVKFARGRSEILLIFLNRPSIFSTPYFQKKYEKRARKNLQRSLKKLSKITRH